jgi:Transposase DDE domain
MMDINGLLKSLNGYLEWNKARVECFILMLLGLFTVKVVNLQEIALAFQSKAKISSRYRRLQRFFSCFEIDYVKIARWIFKLFFKKGEKVYVVIDRTNWFFGKKKINIFMLAVAYEGLAIPLFWCLLDKSGNSNFQERKGLISQFLNIFGRECIEGVLADREFASGKFFKWLNKERIPFFIRIKEGSMAYIRNKKYLTAKKLFKHLNVKEQDSYGMSVNLFGEKVFLAGSRSERGELMIIATNRSPKNAIPKYLRRWEVESLFQSLKSRGFRFEETHLTDLEKIKKLMAVLAIGFAWAHRIGEWLAEKKPIFLKNHGNQKRPEYSYFRYGLDFIRDLIFQPTRKKREFQRCLALILPTTQEALS